MVLRATIFFDAEIITSRLEVVGVNYSPTSDLRSVLAQQSLSTATLANAKRKEIGTFQVYTELG